MSMRRIVAVAWRAPWSRRRSRARDARLSVVYLTVTLGNDAARRLYAELGFRTYGIERRGLRVDGVFHDEELMTLDLD